MTILLYQICFRELSGTPLPNENKQPEGWPKTEVINSDQQSSGRTKDKRALNGMMFMLQ